MRILYVGQTARSSKSGMMLRAMRELGHDVTAVGTDVLDDRGEQVFDRGLVHKVRWKIGLSPDHTNANRSIYVRIQETAYDVLWVTKGLMVKPTSLRRVRAMQPSIRLAFYSTDDMLASHNQSWYFRAGLPLYDVVFTTNVANARSAELPRLGARRVIRVDFSSDRDSHRPVPVSEQQRRLLGGNVGFVGTFERDRAEKLLYLAERGIKVRVWGNSWPRSWIRRHSNLRVEGRGLPLDDYVVALNSTDVNLGFLRKANRDRQTGRSMEIPACAAFMLAERTDEHIRLFEEGKEAEFFGSAEELREKVLYYLDHSDERRRIAEAGRSRCLESGYSFHDKLPGMLSAVRSIS